jgi:hypothetical protein
MPSAGGRRGAESPFPGRRLRPSRLLPCLPYLLPFLVVAAGCQPEQDLGSIPVPNAMPDTYLTGEPPSYLESGFVIRFYWDGFDPDGNIRGYQWRLSSNGTDGISVQDTLTRDPTTGHLMNPWHFTTATETTLVVTADMPAYPDDHHLDPVDQRSWQTHTMFVRAVDEEGGLDPSPAMVSFTATTLTPRVRVDWPLQLNNYDEAQALPRQIVLGFTGRDADSEQNMPSRYRYMLKRAWLNNHYVRSSYEFGMVADDMISLQDSAWSSWRPYPADPAQRRIVLDKLPIREPDGDLIVYLFMIEVEDEAGARSTERSYGVNVQNFFISELVCPTLYIEETNLGRRTATHTIFTSPVDVAPGQTLAFKWIGAADHYGGEIISYRYGWDVGDLDNPDDPGWAVPGGLGAQNLRSTPNSFDGGHHTFVVEVRDNSDQVSRISWQLEVVPVPPPEGRNPLLLIDDVQDRSSHAWAGVTGTPYDNDWYRDAFWDYVLSGAGGVDQWYGEQQTIDTQEKDLTLRDIVGYRVLLCTSRWSLMSQLRELFMPTSSNIPYNWLAAYQRSVGNVFMIGSRVLTLHVEDRRWMIPWVFTATDTYYGSGWWGSWQLGFGTVTLLDGTVVQAGTLRYPYATAGVTVLDNVVPSYQVYGITGGYGIASGARSARCVGVKGLVLNEAFRQARMTGVFVPDTIMTDPTIDWADQDPVHRDHLVSNWASQNDEFYDANITARSTPWQPQDCDGRPCVEPMFQAYPRFDWVKDLHLAAGDTMWPAGIGNIYDICGRYALDPVTDRTLISGKTVGFLSHKFEDEKPSHRGDVYWGFDPYRFDHDAMGEIIHWVLGEHFGLNMLPEAK